MSSAPFSNVSSFSKSDINLSAPDYTVDVVNEALEVVRESRRGSEGESPILNIIDGFEALPGFRPSLDEDWGQSEAYKPMYREFLKNACSSTYIYSVRRFLIDYTEITFQSRNSSHGMKEGSLIDACSAVNFLEALSVNGYINEVNRDGVVELLKFINEIPYENLSNIDQKISLQILKYRAIKMAVDNISDAQELYEYFLRFVNDPYDVTKDAVESLVGNEQNYLLGKYRLTEPQDIWRTDIQKNLIMRISLFTTALGVRYYNYAIIHPNARSAKHYKYLIGLMHNNDRIKKHLLDYDSNDREVSRNVSNFNRMMAEFLS